jgi:hypothetical protein
MKPLTNEIEFKIKTGMEEYRLGEPVIVYMELINSGSEPVEVLKKLEPEVGIVKFFIKKQNEETIFRPYMVVDSLPEKVSLKPGSRISGSAKIFYGGKGWTFNSPGNYQIKATYSGIVKYPDKAIESNTVEVNITGPSSEEEKDEVNLIMGDEQGLFLLFQGGDHLSKGMKNLEELTKKYPQSELAAYADIALGINYSKDFKNFQKREVRKADKEKSLEYLGEGIKKDKDVESMYAKQAYFAMADVYDSSNSTEKKNETLQDFIQRFSGDEKMNKSVEKAKSMIE